MLPTRLISELNASAVHAYLHHCIQQGHVKDAEGTLSIIKNAVVILNTQTDRFECIGERDTLYQYLSSREAPRLSNGEIYDPEHHVIIDVQNRFDIIFRHYCTDVEGYLQRLLDSNAVDEQDLLEHFDRPI